MIKALLYIRIRQFYRGVRHIGLFRTIFVAGLIGFVGFTVFVASSAESTSPGLSLAFLALITIVQLKRNDKLFLKSNFSNPKMLMLSEYILLAIPVAGCLLVHQQIPALALLIGLVLIVHLDIKTKYSALNTRLQQQIPNDAIEWKAGLRKQFFIIVPVWTLALFTSFFIGSVPVAIFILGISTLSFFETCEPIPVLLSYELCAKQLLFLKTRRQLQLFSLLALPLIALFMVFIPDLWYIPVAEYVIFCCLQVYTVLVKYAFFEPNQKSAAAQTFVALGALSCIIPVFLPVIWLLTGWFYKKSVNNLNQFLDDYNS